MKTYGKYRKKNCLVRYLFVDDNNTLISLRLEKSRVRKKIINKYFKEGLK